MKVSTSVMKVSRWFALTALTVAVWSQISLGQGPVSETVPVDGVVGPGLPPIEIFRPNHFDPFHPKKLKFEGFAALTQPGVTGELMVVFDWLGTAGPEFSPPILIPVIPSPTGGPTPVMAMFEIPFCPQQVSLHIDGQPVPMEIHGTFTHECLIPEPSSMALLTVGGLACAAFRRRYSS